METQVLPIGIQSFEIMRQGTAKYLYVDKTALIHKIVSNDVPYFLSRPRRFGKSLLVSTLEAYFMGRKDLFRGLAMEDLEKDWTVYPVFKFDLSTAKFMESQYLNEALNAMLMGYESQYGINNAESSYGVRLRNLIETVYKQTGKRVVVLVDEYDAPMLDSIGDEGRQSVTRNIMRDFFSPLKAQASRLRFVFITGISKFSQLSIFSELNNLCNISMDDEYSDICGITVDELHTCMEPEVEALAKANNETLDEAYNHLRLQYDGYHFSANSKDIYNPFSLINVLAKKRYENYWFSTGTPTFLLELMKKQNLEITDLRDLTMESDDFDAPTEYNPDAIAVLYQSGYLTIKGYDAVTGLYRLGMPNIEVRRGFSDFLLKSFAPLYTRSRRSLSAAFVENLQQGKLADFLTLFKEFLLGFPYDLGENCGEKHYQTILYTVLVTMGLAVNTEVTVAQGRIDMIAFFSDFVYLFEFKLNKTAQQALDQIDGQNYAARFATDKRKLIKAGINFSTQSRTIDDWIIEA